MAQSLMDIVVHIVFSTKGRRPWIFPEIESEFYAYIGGICRNLHCPTILLNGTTDHIHVLLLLSSTISVSDLICKMKSNSSIWIKSKGSKFEDFSWQKGYGAFSVSRNRIYGAVKYIQNQKEHHRVITFQEEMIAMLKLVQVPYDEKYLWN